MLADHRDIDTQVMTAELHHPGLDRGWLAENRQVIEVGPEHRPLTAAFAFAAFTLAALALGQSLIAVHDIDDLLIAALTEHGGERRHRQVPLRLGQIAKRYAVARHHAHRKIGPARF